MVNVSFYYQLIQVALKKRPLNLRCCCCSCIISDSRSQRYVEMV